MLKGIDIYNGTGRNGRINERVTKMSGQQKFEIIKALAYGETPQQTAETEGISVSEVQEVQRTCAAEINAERETLKKAGYIHD